VGLSTTKYRNNVAGSTTKGPSAVLIGKEFFMRSLRINLLSLIFLSVCLGAAAANAEERIAIKAARLIDGTGAPPVEQVVVIVRGGRIESVGSA
jgi:hypothetical protein